MSSQLSPTEELELQRAYRRAIRGLLDLDRVRIEWEGDGGLIVFGYPEVRIDAAEAALTTGFEIIKAIRAIDVVERLHLEVRVGVASGRVTIDKASESLSRIQPISRATRLMRQAGPGQLLVADDTKQLVRSLFEYEDRGFVDLGGPGRTRAWRVVGPSTIVSRFAAQRLGESATAIIGRDGVLQQLSTAWSRALAGEGSAVSLVGDSGIGKSRLARSVLECARGVGAITLEIDCTPGAGNTPLLPIGALLRRRAGIVAGASDADKSAAAIALLTPLLGGEEQAREALKHLAPLFGIETSPVPLEMTPGQVRIATIAAITAIVRALAQDAPVAVLCEDLHWADASTALVVQAVAQIAAGARMLVLVTRWPTAVTPIDLESVTAGFTSIPIEPLLAEHAADLVRALASDVLPPAHVEAIVGRCGGVPLLLEEVTRSAIAETAAPDTVAAPAPDSSVPPALQLVVEARLEQQPGLRRVVEAASVLGRDFPIAALATMVPGEDSLLDTLDRLAAEGLFRPASASRSDRASFRHALLRDAVYETIVSGDYLRRLHSLAADTLGSRYQGTPDASPDVLAHHLRMAGRLGQAIATRLAAGEDTFSRGAYVEAKGHCDAVRALLRESGRIATNQDRFRLCVLLGMIETGARGYSAEEAEAAYREAEATLDEETSPASRYPVIRGLATSSLVQGDLVPAYERSCAGLDIAEASGRPDYRIDAMSVLAYTSMYVGRLEDSRQWIERCLALYEAENGSAFRYPVPQDAKTAALALLPTVAWLQGDPSGAEEAIVRGLDHVERLGREFDRALLHAWTAGTRYTQRRYRDALHHAGIAYTLGTTHGFDEWQGVGAMMAAISQSALTPAAEAIQQAVRIGELFRHRHVGLNASYFLIGIARGQVMADDEHGARETLDAALAAARGEERMHPEIWLLLAEIESDRERARTLAAQAYALAAKQGVVPTALRAAAMMIAQSAAPPSDVAWSRETLDLLDHKKPADAEPPTWLRDRLARAAALVSLL
jgi:hypothetical protein